MIRELDRQQVYHQLYKTTQYYLTDLSSKVQQSHQVIDQGATTTTNVQCVHNKGFAPTNVDQHF
jgi:hypothetical protein